MHVAFFGLFCYSIAGTRAVVPQRQKDFLRTLLLAGAAWFLVTPLLVLVAPLLSKVVRHRFVTAGTITTQSLALVMMTRLFLTRQSEYYKLSSVGNLGSLLGISSPRSSMGSKVID